MALIPKLAAGTLFQIGNGIIGAGTSEQQTITFGGTPAAGAVVFAFWGIPIASLSTAAGLPTAAALAAALNAAVAPAYLNPFAVALVGMVYTVTYQGPFALMPMPLITVITNTSLQTITIARSVPGVTQETFATLAQVTTMPFPTPKRGMKPYTNFDSPSNYVQKIPGFKDAGNVKLDFNFLNEATQNIVTGIMGQFEGGLTFDYRIVVPTTNTAATLSSTSMIQGITYYYSGFIADLQPMGATPEDILKFAATVEISGPVTYFPPTA